nr:nucleotidyltransferase family protein [Acidobacteriota bacterium]
LHYGSHAPPARLTIDFVVQAEPLGTADAVLAVEPWADDEPFLTMNADNLYPSAALRDLAMLDEPGLLAFERGELARSGNIPDARVQSFALLEVNDHGYLERIVEKPSQEVFARAGERSLVSMNCWRFDHRIFDACRDVPRSPRGELELPIAVGLAVDRGTPFRVVPARGAVLDVSTRADAAEVTRRLEAVTPLP